MKDDFVKTTFAIGKLDVEATEIFVVLIPKLDDPKSFNDFKPINLCNVVYKLIYEILVNKFCPFLQHLVNLFHKST